MVTLNKVAGQVEERSAQFYGLAKDTKPKDGVVNGSTFYEMDTKKAFMYDEENEVWIEQ